MGKLCAYFPYNTCSEKHITFLPPETNTPTPNIHYLFLLVFMYLSSIGFLFVKNRRKPSSHHLRIRNSLERKKAGFSAKTPRWTDMCQSALICGLGWPYLCFFFVPNIHSNQKKRPLCPRTGNKTSEAQFYFFLVPNKIVFSFLSLNFFFFLFFLFLNIMTPFFSFL